MVLRDESVFRNRSFSLFYAGQAFSYVGDGLRLIAVPLLVYHLTGSALSVGLTYTLELGPFAIFGLLGGSLADRLDRRKLMIACDLVRFVVVALFALGYALGFLSLPLLYGGIVLLSIAAAFFLGGQASSIPYLIGKDRATKAMSALLAAEQISQTVVPPIGGALFALLGPLPALAGNACTYLISQGSLAAIETLGPRAPSGLPTAREIGADIAIGFRQLWRDPAARALSSVLLLFNCFGWMIGAAFIPFLKRDFGASDAVVGYALGISAVGAALGSWLAGKVPASWPFGRVIAVSYAIDSLLFLPVMFVHRLDVAIVFLSLTERLRPLRDRADHRLAHAHHARAPRRPPFRRDAPRRAHRNGSGNADRRRARRSLRRPRPRSSLPDSGISRRPSWPQRSQPSGASAASGP